MKFKVKIYMKSGNVIDLAFKELTYIPNKSLSWVLADNKQQIIRINLDDIEAIIQYGVAP